jgi:hypothetical protein
MKRLFFIGLACVVLGLLSLFIDIPHAKQQSFQTGTIQLGVSQTEQRGISGIVPAFLIAGGLGMMVAGCRESAKPQDRGLTGTARKRRRSA